MSKHKVVTYVQGNGKTAITTATAAQVAALKAAGRLKDVRDYSKK